MQFHEDGTLPPGDAIFVFGSNLRGIHGAGAARIARLKFGAVQGVGAALMGSSYAIPTKTAPHGSSIALYSIDMHVRIFLDFARHVYPRREFFVTRIGCGLAGFRDAQIAPMFAGAPDNCSFAEEWRPFLQSGLKK